MLLIDLRFVRELIPTKSRVGSDTMVFTLGLRHCTCSLFKPRWGKLATHSMDADFDGLDDGDFVLTDAQAAVLARLLELRPKL